MLDFLKKWWKYLVGFFTVVLFLFLKLMNKKKWGEFHENSVKNLKGQTEAEKDAAVKFEEGVDEINKKFDDSLNSVIVDSTEKKEKIKNSKEEFKKGTDEVGKKIAEDLGIIYVKSDD